MTDEQRSLSGYKSTVHEQGEFENPNDGKPLLNENDEYVIRLKSFPRVKAFQQVKEKKDGSRTTISVDKAICEFEDVASGNTITAFFRIDSLNFSEDESYQSAIIRFFKKIGNPLTEGISPDWDKMFVVGMRFRGRVVVGRGADKQPDGRYYLDIPTCRKLLPSDTAGESFGTQIQDAPNLLANALLLAKGAKDIHVAMDMLQKAGTTKEVVMALFRADLDGKVTYPI
jgi:hypothetical protein